VYICLRVPQRSPEERQFAYVICEVQLLPQRSGITGMEGERRWLKQLWHRRHRLLIIIIIGDVPDPQISTQDLHHTQTHGRLGRHTVHTD